jgi:hypothetical protein
MPCYDGGDEDCRRVEIFSKENCWKRPGEEVIATSIERYRRLC